VAIVYVDAVHVNANTSLLLLNHNLSLIGTVFFL